MLLTISSMLHMSSSLLGICSTYRGAARPRSGPSWLPAEQVAQQGDLGAVVQGLAVDVQHERGQRDLGVRAFRRAAGAGETPGAQSADAGRPRGVDLIEPCERGDGVTP